MNVGKRVANIGIPFLLGNRRGHAVALLLLYLLLLVEYYGFIYSNYFSLMGFDYRFNPVAFLSGLLMLAAAVAMLAAVPGDKGRLYTVGVVVAMLFCLPQIVLFQIGKAQPYGALYSLLLLFLVTTPLLRLPQARTPRLPARWLWWLLPLLAVLALIPFVKAYGLSFNLHRFSLGQDIYQARAAASARGTTATDYLLGPLTRLMLPLMLVYGLCCLRRRWWMVVLALALTLYLFFITPQKTILFSLGLVAVCFFFRNNFAKAGMLLYGLLLLCGLAVALRLATHAVMLESIVVRRLFFIPAIVQENYFTFFEHHPVCLSHSFLSGLFDYPYQLDPPHLIGQMMYNRPTTSCNTGVTGDGFMNFGHAGAFLFTAVAALLIRLVDSTGYDSRYIGLVAVLMLTFLNGALCTTLHTHGGLLLIVAFFFLVPAESRGDSSSNQPQKQCNEVAF